MTENPHKRHDIDTGEQPLQATETPPSASLGSFASNNYGNRYLQSVNPNVFEKNNAEAVFHSYFGDTLFEKNTFYIIVGTDSSLLYRHIKTRGIPSNSRYLFIELPQILPLLGDMENEHPHELAVTADEDWMTLADELEIQKYTLLKRVKLIRSLGVVHNHLKDYARLWQRLSEDVNTFIWQQGIILTTNSFIDCQIANLAENQTPAIKLKDTFRGKTAVLLAGGPSLSDLLPWVRQHRKNLLVIAVSRISQILRKASIQPDICVSVDPTIINIGVSREMLEFGEGTLLLNKFHLTPGLLSSWKCKKVFIGSRYPWPTPQEPQNLDEPIGATVTNTAVGVAIDMGVSQIILGGVDLCFSPKGYTHATGSAEHNLGSMPSINEQRTETNNGLSVNTTNAFHNSAMALDLQAKEAQQKGCQIINPAPGAMRIPHVKHVPLSEISINPLQQLASQTITTSLPESNPNTRVEHYREVLTEVDRILKELKDIKALSNKALKLGQKLLNKSGQQADLHDKAIARIEKQLYGKYVDTTTFIKKYGLQQFVDILDPDQQDSGKFEHTSQLYFQAFVDTANKITDVLRNTRVRILSRIEEEKPHPNVIQLTEQWITDQQPGRIHCWLHQHADIATQLSDEEQKAVRHCQQTFEDLLEKINKLYLLRLEQYTALDTVSSDAAEFFRAHDTTGLQRLLETLRSHKKQAEAAQYIHLLQGYLAEMENDPASAIDAYRKVTEEPQKTDATIRLFALYNETGNQTAAMETLQTLSAKNPLYLPLLADMLHATGDTQTAVDTYTNYLLDHPDDLDAMMKLGRIFLDAGSAEGVSWTMGYILEKDPEHAAARQLIESLTQPQAND